jgi:preprotein translocase subunit SecG
MKKSFLLTRIIILLALLFVVAAIFWGWANQTKPAGGSGVNHYEKYNAKKPGSGTTAFFVVGIFVGIFIILASIWLEWRRSRETPGPAGKNAGKNAAAGAAGNRPAPRDLQADREAEREAAGAPVTAGAAFPAGGSRQEDDSSVRGDEGPDAGLSG